MRHVNEMLLQFWDSPYSHLGFHKESFIFLLPLFPPPTLKRRYSCVHFNFRNIKILKDIKKKHTFDQEKIKKIRKKPGSRSREKDLRKKQ